MVLETFNNAEIIDTNEEELRLLFYKIFVYNKKNIKKDDKYKPNFDIIKKYQNDTLNNLNTQSYLQNFKFLNMNNLTKNIYCSVKNDFYINRKKETDDTSIIESSKYSFLQSSNFIDCNYLWNECIDQNLFLNYCKFDCDKVELLNEKKSKKLYYEENGLKINYDIKSCLEKFGNFFENIYLLDNNKNILNNFQHLFQVINMFNDCYKNNTFDTYFSSNKNFYIEELLHNYLKFLDIKDDFDKNENCFYLDYLDFNFKNNTDVFCLVDEGEQININYSKLLESSKTNNYNINIIIKNSRNLKLLDNFIKKMKLFVDKYLHKIYKSQNLIKYFLKDQNIPVYNSIISGIENIKFNVDKYEIIKQFESKFYKCNSSKFNLRLFSHGKSIVKIKIENKDKVEFYKIYTFNDFLDININFNYLFCDDNELVLSITCLFNNVFI